MKAGYAKRDITPAQSTQLAGFDRRTEPSNGVLDSIELVAMAFVDGQGQPFVLLVFDLLGVRSALCARIKQALFDAYHLPPERIFVGATHTHSAPHVPVQTDDPVIAQYTEYLISQSVCAVGEALEHTEPVEPSFAEAHATGVASLRNRGREGSAFPMPMLLTKLHGKERDYVLTRISCHPTVLDEKNRLVSRDLPGQLRDYLGVNSLCLVQNGACADLSTRFTRTASDAAELRRLGTMLGETADSTMGVPCPAFGERITAVEQTVVLPCAADLAPEKRQSLLDALRQKAAECTDTQALREYDSRIVVLERAVGKKETVRTIHIGAVDFGPYILVSTPFEVDYGDSIHLEEVLSQAAGKPVYLVCYTGGYDGYLPSGDPLTADSSYEDIASPYLPEARKLVWECALQCVKALR